MCHRHIVAKATFSLIDSHIYLLCRAPQRIVTGQLCSYRAAKAEFAELTNVKYVLRIQPVDATH